MYHFVNLTEAQTLQRRQLLDFYAAVAQISAFVPLLVLQGYFFALWTKERLQRRRAYAPSSPLTKSNLSRNIFALRRARVWFQRLLWLAGNQLEVLGYPVGTIGVVTLAIVWTLWLLALCCSQTADDYLHLTKRFGIVAASQLPFHYLLAFKSPFSPIQILTRCSHETLNSAHQLLGRVITFLLYLHAASYLNFYVQKGLLGSKITELYVICGLLGIISFTAVGTTALSPVRRRSYRMFYTVHVVLATTLLPILFFHVSHIRIYLYETALVYALNALLRALCTETYDGSTLAVAGTNLLRLQISLKSSHGRHGLESLWQPGQHAYICLPSNPFLRTFQSNPFTVASLPSVDGCLTFVARILDGNTARLAANAGKSIQLTVEGPYGVSTHAERLLPYDRVLFIAGGVGATFIVPLYRQLLADLSPSRGSYRRQRVKMVWAVRAADEAEWALPADSQERAGFVDRAEVYLTRASGEGRDGTEGTFVLRDEEDDVKMEAGEGIELEEHNRLLAQPDTGLGSDRSVSDERSHGNFAYRHGRPNIARLVDEAFSHGASERVAVLVCGPSILTKAVRHSIGTWVDKGRQVWFWAENFGL